MRRTHPKNVWPLDRVDQHFAEDLQRLFPDVLLIWHPIEHAWQVYICLRPGLWDAEQLVNAIIREREVRRHLSENTDAVFDWPKVKWWDRPDAPEIFEHRLPMRPGSWLLQYLKYAEVPTPEFLRRVEEDVARAEIKQANDRHDMHMWVASQTYRHMRDFARGDPLAGQRKWTAPVGMDLKGGS